MSAVQPAVSAAETTMTTLDERYRIANYIDTFALGHYARVLDAQDRKTSARVALKVLRPEHLGGDKPRWEYQAFAHEADLLTALADSPTIVRLLDCGYLEASGDAPSGGGIVSLGTVAAAFRAAQDRFFKRGWRPYLALELLPRTNNLFYLMRPDRAGLRWRVPTEEGLALALQFAETLKMAPRQGIVYLDHKLEHVYWDGVQLRILDLNSSRRIDGKSRDAEGLFRQDIHSLCVGILYSMFTGLSPQKTALRPQPSGAADVEARYQAITTLDFGVEPSLSPALQALLQRGAAGQIESVDDFIDGLQSVAALHGWDFPGHYTNPHNRDARAHLRAGLTKLRKGQDALREARDLFREAAILDGITDDLDAELRRLVKAVNEMLNNRVVP
jgi:serine/threonine protein kinase